MTDDPAAIRAVLREHGIEVPDRGRISAEHMAAYERIRSGDTGADYVGADEPDLDDGPDYPPPGEEKQPKRPRGPSAKARAQGWRDRFGQRKPRSRSGTARKKVKHPRVKVDDLIATGWEMLGRLTQPVSLPVSRTFKLQAPVAGLVLEDAFRGTVVDRVLQPLARSQQRGKTVAALAGPPLIVGAMERAQGFAEPARSMRLNVLGGMLEECMLLWQEVAGDKFEEAAERMAERERDRHEVRKLISDVIFAPETPVVCGQLIGRMPDGSEVRCVRPPDHEGLHAASDDQAAAYAQQMAGV